MVLYVHWVVMALTHHESDLQILYVWRGGVLLLLVYFQLIVPILDNCYRYLNGLRNLLRGLILCCF